MEDFLTDIYRDAELFTKLKMVVEYCQKDNSHHAVMELNKILPKFSKIYDSYVKINSEDAENLKNSIYTLSETRDVLLMGDIIEGNILPILGRYVQYRGKIDVEGDNNLKFESSYCGFLTMKDTKEDRYFHSVMDPMWEARQLALSFFDYGVEQYSILGCGLGYLPYQLYCLTEGSVPIHIYEREQVIVDYAEEYGVLSWIPDEVLTVIVDDDVIPFLDSIENGKTGYHIFAPELKRIPTYIQQIMNGLYLNDITVRMMRHEEKINFEKNKRSKCLDVSKIKFEKQTDKYIVVAAGPSVDECLDYLKEQTDKIIIAVGTIFRKLMKNGIVPDLVVVLDPQSRTIHQFDGAMESQVPLLITMTAYWEFADRYQGAKYMVPVQSNLDVVSEYCTNNGIKQWRVGGTVTFFAMEAAIHFGAKEIYLTGVDLAYPNGYTHATGTMDYKKIAEKSRLIEIEDVNGKKVLASEEFNEYRKNIEELIEETSEIKYYNLSSCGAYIKGTEKIM